MKVLVTGASGFIGRHVLRILNDSNCRVYATSRKLQFSDDNHIEWITVDLLDEDKMRCIFTKYQPDVLIHLAWYAEHGKFWDDLQNFDWSVATVNMLDAFVQGGGSRIVIAGTCAEYDWNFGYCTENLTPTEPSTLYGACKDATRRLTKIYAHQAGIQWAWGRIFFPFGIGEPETRLLPSVINSALSNQPVLCSHGRQYRDFIPIEDVASAFVHLALNTPEVGEFNISTGIPTRISDLVQYCIDYLGINASPEYGAIKVPESDPPILVGDNRKLLQSGWKPNHSWQSAIVRFIDEYKSKF